MVELEQEVRIMFSENCIIPARDSLTGAAIIFYELGKVRVQKAQN